MDRKRIKTRTRQAVQSIPLLGLVFVRAADWLHEGYCQARDLALEPGTLNGILVRLPGVTFRRLVVLLGLKRVYYVCARQIQTRFFQVMRPVDALLVRVMHRRAFSRSVLHISFMVHIPFYATRILREHGIKADYLAVGGRSPWWDKVDYQFERQPMKPWREWLFFWRVVARYEAIHSHFGIMLSESGWEIPLLKRMGRRIVVHFRGCEVRDSVLNQQLHPDVNLCEACDYHGSVCREGKPRVEQARAFGDVFLVTTPDMRDFIPDAIHFPFFTPYIDYARYAAIPILSRNGRPFKIVHVTNHPGLEGTARIRQAIDNLRQKGYNINLVFLKGVTPERALEEYRDADVSIGKMTMGYYANAQIESMYLGVPAITYIRPEFMNEELQRSGLIICHLHDLEATLEHYLLHPHKLEAKRAIARSSILALHDNAVLARRLIDIYFPLAS